VRGLINLLHTCGYVKYPLGQSRFFFSEKVEDAVKKFQRAHHLKADGVVGSHTMVTLKAAARWHKRHS
jgi:murein L,D-transpeptidase YcbB/YkuD